MDARRSNFVTDDGNCFHGVCSSLGTNEFLGRYRNNKPFLRNPTCGRVDRYFVVGRLFR